MYPTLVRLLNLQGHGYWMGINRYVYIRLKMKTLGVYILICIMKFLKRTGTGKFTHTHTPKVTFPRGFFF